MTQLSELIAKKIKDQLPKDQLEHRIATFFREQTMCTLATSSPDSPRATPLECFPDGLTLFIMGDPGRKIGNIRTNPRVSIAICNQLNPSWIGESWKTHKAAQITGEAKILDPDDPERIRALREVVKFDDFLTGLDLDREAIPSSTAVIKVMPLKIEYSESALMLEGYSRKQVWEA
jgi:nitroimidazol reductase NimA-like FMN-containing flavoprotein (pyridoxamine 5'-phosphate oxidase superfamily)